MAASSIGVAGPVPSSITEIRYFILGHLLGLGRAWAARSPLQRTALPQSDTASGRECPRSHAPALLATSDHMTSVRHAHFDQRPKKNENARTTPRPRAPRPRDRARPLSERRNPGAPPVPPHRSA